MNLLKNLFQQFKQKKLKKKKRYININKIRHFFFSFLFLTTASLNNISINDLSRLNKNFSLQQSINISESLKPLIDLIQPFFIKISIIVGGIFGIYFLLLISRLYYERKKIKLLKDIRYNLDKLNEHYGIKNSRDKKNLFQKIIISLQKILQKKNKNSKQTKNNNKL